MAMHTMRKKYAATDARGEAEHVATHTRTNKKIRRQQEQQTLHENADQNSDEARLRTLLQYGQEKRRILENAKTPWGHPPQHRKNWKRHHRRIKKKHNTSTTKTDEQGAQ